MIVLYTRKNCAACKKIKKELDENNTSYKLIDIDTLPEQEIIKLIEKHGSKVKLPIIEEHN